MKIPVFFRARAFFIKRICVNWGTFLTGTFLIGNSIMGNGIVGNGIVHADHSSFQDSHSRPRVAYNSPASYGNTRSHDITHTISRADTAGTIDADKAHLFAIVRTELRKPEYAQEILPNDFSYLNQLLIYGQEMRNRQHYARSVFGIFSKVIGGSSYVNAHAFVQLLEQFPHSLKPYFVSYKSSGTHKAAIGLDGDMFDRFKEAVSNLLYVQFSTQYDAFKASPVPFFDELSHYIVDLAKQEVNAYYMRVAIKRFIELSIGKLVWSPEDHAQIWGTVKSMSHHLSLLVEQAVIEDPNDLDDIYWTLIHRFNYFLDLCGVQLPASFYQEIKSDIASDTLLLLTLAEQDFCIQTKRECLIQALLEAEAKSRAYEKGILTA